MPIQNYIKGSREFTLEASLANIPDYIVQDAQGYNETIGSSSFQTVWPSSQLREYSNTGVQLSISSDSNDDTDVTGIGARDVAVFLIRRTHGTNIYYRDLEIIKLTGTTPVLTTATDIVRCYSVLIRQCGSNQKNVGTIYAGSGTVTAGVPATIYSLSPAGVANPILPDINYLPTEVAFIRNLTFSVAGNKSATVQVVTYGAENIYRVLYQFEVQGSLVRIPFDPTRIQSLSSTDIQIRAKSDTGTVSIFFNIQVVIVSGWNLRSPFEV